MDIEYSNRTHDIIIKVADEYNVDVDDLELVYETMLESNFEQDLIDLAKDMPKHNGE